jgi:hypothetical protein
MHKGDGDSNNKNNMTNNNESLKLLGANGVTPGS